MTLRIVLADDHKLFMQGLMTLLEGEPEFQVVGTAANGAEVVELVRRTLPDVVIMDVDMPELDGIEATRAIIGEGMTVKVVALSMHDNKYHVLHMLEAGALGYILKDTIFEDLVKAVKVVAKGESYLSPRIARVVIREMSRLQESAEGALETLTIREQEVLKGIAEGKRSRDIGSDLFISEKTVENHRKNIMTKLNIHSIAELTKFAIKHNLTDL